jgi:hypothetical protein
MAIVIEEEKSRTNIMGIAGWLVFLAIAAAAIYYIFFAPAASIVIVPPANLASIAPLSQLTINPQNVTTNQLFQSLQQYVPSSTAQSAAAVGRANPLVPPQ